MYMYISSNGKKKRLFYKMVYTCTCTCTHVQFQEGIQKA